jgi:hypothetical protein
MTPLEFARLARSNRFKASELTVKSVLEAENLSVSEKLAQLEHERLYTSAYMSAIMDMIQSLECDKGNLYMKIYNKLDEFETTMQTEISKLEKLNKTE